jgi:hypothetical protein
MEDQRYRSRLAVGGSHRAARVLIVNDNPASILRLTVRYSCLGVGAVSVLFAIAWIVGTGRGWIDTTHEGRAHLFLAAAAATIVSTIVLFLDRNRYKWWMLLGFGLILILGLLFPAL